MRRKQFPPNGRRLLTHRNSAGVWVAFGPGAWRFASAKPFPVLVLPHDSEPECFKWPVRDEDVLVVEVGTYDTVRLERLAQVLLESGANLVQSVRTANYRDNRAFWRRN
jgi:hypothetical protein